jgi:hypothetical protein
MTGTDGGKKVKYYKMDLLIYITLERTVLV